MLRSKVGNFLRKHHITKHMMKVYCSLFTIMFSVGFTITMVFPYLPFMVKFLLPHVEDRNIGRYAGFLASSMYFGRFCGSYFWGWLADVQNKKTILMYSGICMAFSSFFFGFSVNFYMAVIFRFLTGLMNGIVGNAKALLCEHSDDVNQGLGMSMVVSAWGASIVFGPATSGLLADPVDQYKLPPNSFLEKFPYCIPSMFSALISLVGVVTVGCLLPDKPENKYTDDDKKIDLSNKENIATEELVPMDSINVETHDCSFENNSDLQQVAELQSESKDNVPLKLSVNGLSYKKLLEKEEAGNGTVIFNEEDIVMSTARNSKLNFKDKLKRLREHVYASFQVFMSLLKNKVAVGSILIYSLFSFGVIGFDECFSLWSATRISLGGLGFSLHNIGTVLAIVGVLMIPCSSLLFAPFERKFGALLTHHIHTASLIIILPIFPSLTYFSETPGVLWTFLIILLLIIRVSFNNCIVAQGLFINNSVTPDKLGAVNGLGITVTSLFRTFAPIAFGAIYSLSLSDTAEDIGFPFDFHLIFILFSLTYLLTMVIVAFFPKRLDKQRK
ncbi:uncharacterized protein [Dysidea avara]|uniref:uncharacterized protein isoform X1 n=1 Tax=Dysidea avara TaxID=196820 RepID=UPI0033258626